MPHDLDTILQERKTCRSFADTPVDRAHIEAVIEAGRQAPFAGLAQAGNREFRFFFVLSPASPVCETLARLVADMREARYRQATAQGYAEKYPHFMKVLEAGHGKPVDNLFISPVMVLVAERGGMPAREHVVLGHVLQNMWLKATALGLGFRPCSAVADIRDTAALAGALALPPDSYAFDACNIGYAGGAGPAPRLREVPTPFIRYL